MALIKTNARSASALDATILTGALPAISGASLTGITTGKVLQVVSAYDSTPYFATTSTTLQTTDITVTITPSATSSKILLFTSFNAATWDGDASNPILFMRKNVGGGGDEGVYQIDDIIGYYINNQNNDYVGTHFLDSPSTTSEIVYYVQLASRTSGVYSKVGNYYASANKGGSAITALEIGA